MGQHYQMCHGDWKQEDLEMPLWVMMVQGEHEEISLSKCFKIFGCLSGTVVSALISHTKVGGSNLAAGVSVTQL